MFHDCAHALNVDTSGWPTMPMFQAQQEEEAALEADDPMRDL